MGLAAKKARKNEKYPYGFCFRIGHEFGPLVKLIADLDQRNIGTTIEILIANEAARRGILPDNLRKLTQAPQLRAVEA